MQNCSEYRNGRPTCSKGFYTEYLCYHKPNIMASSTEMNTNTPTPPIPFHHTRQTYERQINFSTKPDEEYHYHKKYMSNCYLKLTKLESKVFRHLSYLDKCVPGQTAPGQMSPGHALVHLITDHYNWYIVKTSES